MPLSVTATANQVAQYWGSLGNTYSLHTANPGAAGTANEATGGGYSRKTTTFGAPASGVVTGTKMTFDVAQGTYPYACRWAGTTLLDVFKFPDPAPSVTPAGQIDVIPTSAAAIAAVS